MNYIQRPIKRKCDIDEVTDRDLEETEIIEYQVEDCLIRLEGGWLS